MKKIMRTLAAVAVVIIGSVVLAACSSTNSNLKYPITVKADADGKAMLQVSKADSTRNPISQTPADIAAGNYRFNIEIDITVKRVGTDKTEQPINKADLTLKVNGASVTVFKLVNTMGSEQTTITMAASTSSIEFAVLCEVTQQSQSAPTAVLQWKVGGKTTSIFDGNA